ncbi:MAG: NYN domain-containing protein [Cyanobacteria bacterium P01_D01_bin.71]
MTPTILTDRCSPQLAKYEAIAVKICNLLIKIQAVHPEWIQERFRHLLLSDHRAKLVQQFSTHLQKPVDQATLIAHINRLIAQLLIPAATTPQLYQQLNQFLAAELTSAEFSAPLPKTTAAGSKESDRTPKKVSSGLQAISILLLDAENIDLDQAAEAWLAKQCQYPLSLKFAFGNWKKLGNRDLILHQQGYHLIHVPSGKNLADIKMTVLGASLSVHLPAIKAAMICSNDSDLVNLRDILNCQCLDVSLLQRHEYTLTLTDCRTQRKTTFSLPQPAQMPSVEKGIQFCQTCVRPTAETGMLLSQLASSFAKTFQFPLRVFVKHHGLAKSPKALFQTLATFEVFVKKSDSQTYIRTGSSSGDVKVTNAQTGRRQAKAFTPARLRIVAVGITKRLLKETDSQTVVVGAIAAAFRQQQGCAMKATLKELDLPLNLPKFLQICDGLTLRRSHNQWLVALAEQK